jgi:tetratricopeptide (TPR) repeat protein
VSSGTALLERAQKLNALACAYLGLEEFAKAEAALREALKLRPGFVTAIDNLGIVHAQSGRYEAALELYDLAIGRDPSVAVIHMHRAEALLGLERYEEAWASCERAIRLAPGDPSGYNALGLIADALDRIDAAETCFGAALAVNPAYTPALCNLADVLVKRGDIAAATHTFQHALELEPANGTYHLRLVNSRLGAADEAQVAEMEQLLADAASLRPTHRIDLHYALASVKERLGDFETAFRHLRAANEIKRGQIEYDESARMNFFASLEQAFAQPFMTALRGHGNPSERPIFVFGMPRSGSTLVEQLLAATPLVAAAGEVNVFDVAISEELMAPGMQLADLRVAMAAVGDRYIRATDSVAGGSVRVTDKMLHNFCYAPLIHLALPNARMIHVRRDRIDTCFSCYATNFTGRGLSYTYDLAELGRYYSAYERLMAKWRSLLPADRFLEVDYEELVAGFETQARRIMDFCGLPWDARVLEFHTVRRTVRTASNVQVRRPLYHSAVGRSGRFAAHLGPLIEAFKQA